MTKKIDLTGMQFGRLTVIQQSTAGSYGTTRWQCICECGNTTIAWSKHIRKGLTRSCGCLRSELLTTHGASRPSKGKPTKGYRTWADMIQRCYNPNNANFKYYGNRGILVCDRWLEDYANFRDDMGEPPPNMTIERKNNDGDYESRNCIWADRKTQDLNRRDTIHIVVDGSLIPLTTACQIHDVNRNSVYEAVRRNHTAHQSEFDRLRQRRTRKT